MTSRLLVGGVAWLAALLLLGAALESSLRARALPSREPPSELARRLNTPRPSAGQQPARKARRGTWKVTGASSTFHFMSVEVEAERVDDAMAIAVEIVKPADLRFDEILIYVRKVGASRSDPARRVQ